MRVLDVIHYPVFGGPHNQALRLSAPMRDRGWDTIVLLPDEPGNAKGRLVDGGVEVVTIPLHRLRATADPRPHLALALGLVGEVRAIRRLIRDRSVDLVQVSGLVNPHAAIAARQERVPVVWQLLDTRAPRLLALMSMQFVSRLADAVMSTGRAVALAHPGGADLRDRVVPYFPPVDTALFRPLPEQRSSVRSDWGVPQEALIIGCVANVNPQKGIVDLVRAFARVRAEVADAHLVVIGAEHATHEAYAAEVRATAAEAGLSMGKDVVLVGERSDVERQLAGFDVFAFAPPPRSEGVSTVVLEAMAAGLPVITTAVGGLAEAVDDGVTGRLIPPGDLESVVIAIVGLLKDRETAREMGRAAREAAVARFTVSVCADVHALAYGMAMERRGRKAS
jgi:glycosyltransferase involved in cell wall biosynthesis